MRQALGACHQHVGGDAPPSEIQFLRGNGNIHRSEVEAGEIKEGKKKKKKTSLADRMKISRENVHFFFNIPHIS